MKRYWHTILFCNVRIVKLLKFNFHYFLGKNALVLGGIAITGAKYYISNTNDESDITAFIHKYTYKISFEAVN